jgi:hypothetical protein
MRDDIIAALRALEDERGRLTPEIVLEAARDPESPLHDQFEWNVEEAARKHNLARARALLRSVRVRLTVTRIPFDVPVYVRNPDAAANQQGYRRLARIKGERETAIEAALAELERARALLGRARKILTALGFVGRLDEIIAGLDGLIGAVNDEGEAGGAAAGEPDSPAGPSPSPHPPGGDEGRCGAHDA